jgi:hypothetical protein
MNRLMVCKFFLLTHLVSLACFAGDPFYHSTWYAQPSLELTWSSQSVLSADRWQSPVIPGPVGYYSPRNFRPGYGYIGSIPGVYWPTYEPHWSHGVLQPLHTSDSFLDRTNSYGVSTVLPGTLHHPWHFPGSPGNSRSDLRQ